MLNEFYENSVGIYLIPGATDMRKGYDKLMQLVASKTDQNFFHGGLFVFAGRNLKTIKILYWDTNGFCIWQKRLDKEKFWWPKDTSEVCKITSKQLRWLLDGLNPMELKGHKELKYSIVC